MTSQSPGWNSAGSKSNSSDLLLGWTWCDMLKVIGWKEVNWRTAVAIRVEATQKKNVSDRLPNMRPPSEPPLEEQFSISPDYCTNHKKCPIN
jgi:hypothetical protein